MGKAHLPIERMNGADGKVEVKWRTKDISAHSGQDYEGGEGVIVFEHGETTKTLELTVYDDQVCIYKHSPLRSLSYPVLYYLQDFKDQSSILHDLLNDTHCPE